MNGKTLIGIGVLVLSAVLLYLGYTASQGMAEQITETVTGKYSDGTVWYFLCAAVARVAGLTLIVHGQRR